MRVWEGLFCPARGPVLHHSPTARRPRPRAPAPPPPVSPWQVCRQLYVAEGLRGFSRGLGARVATMSTGSAVTWLTYESVKRWLARRAAAEEGDVAAAAGGAAAVAGAAERSAAAAAGDSAAGDALPVRHKAEAS